jgi:hypothetical protein
LERLQAVGREPDRLRGCEVIISPQDCGAGEESDDAESDDRDTSFHVSLRYRDVTIAYGNILGVVQSPLASKGEKLVRPQQPPTGSRALGAAVIMVPR